jgi:hypothetical protein
MMRTVPSADSSAKARAIAWSSAASTTLTKSYGPSTAHGLTTIQAFYLSVDRPNALRAVCDRPGAFVVVWNEAIAWTIASSRPIECLWSGRT